MIKVKATRFGFYGLIRRREGDVFEITSKKEMGSWMELVDPPVGEAIDLDSDDSGALSLRQIADDLTQKAELARVALKQNSPKTARKAVEDLEVEAAEARKAAEAAEEFNQ